MISLCMCALLAFGYIGKETWHNNSENIVLSVRRPAETQSKSEELSLPYTVRQTGFVVQALTSYEGPFLEDGSYEEVVDVAALLVSNTTEDIMKSVTVLVETNREIMCFTGTWLPPKSTCVLLSQEKSIYIPSVVLDITAQTEKADVAVYTDQLLWTEEEDGIHLTNVSQKDLYGIRVLFKTYLQQTGQYIGGVTNEAVVERLPAGKTTVLLPPYYVKDYTRVVTVVIAE